MGKGESQGYTPEQLKHEKSRTIRDAELLKGGAEYVEGRRLELTPEQLEKKTPEGVYRHLVEHSDPDSWEHEVELTLKEQKFDSYLDVARYRAELGNVPEVVIALEKTDLKPKDKYELTARALRKKAEELEEMIESGTFYPDISSRKIEGYRDMIEEYRDMAEILTGRSEE